MTRSATTVIDNMRAYEGSSERSSDPFTHPEGLANAPEAKKQYVHPNTRHHVALCTLLIPITE